MVTLNNSLKKVSSALSDTIQSPPSCDFSIPQNGLFASDGARVVGCLALTVVDYRSGENLSTFKHKS